MSTDRDKLEQSLKVWLPMMVEKSHKVRLDKCEVSKDLDGYSFAVCSPMNQHELGFNVFGPLLLTQLSTIVDEETLRRVEEALLQSHKNLSISAVAFDSKKDGDEVISPTDLQFDPEKGFSWNMKVSHRKDTPKPVKEVEDDE